MSRDKNGIFFSVPPQKGYPQVDTDYGVSYVSQRAPAVDFSGNLLGTVRFVASGDTFYGGSRSKDYASKVYTNPTWAQVKAVAGQAMKRTGDFHHSFLEGVSFTGRTVDGVREFSLVMGS